MINIFRRLHQKQKGEILIITMIIMAVGFLIIPSTLFYAYTVRTSSRSYENHTSELYAADSGVQDAYWQLKQATPDPNKVPPSTVNSSRTYSIAAIDGGQPSITILCTQVAGTGVTYKVTSRSAASGPYTEVDAYIVVTPQANIFNYALATGSGGNVNLSGASIIDSDSGNEGDIFSGGGLTLAGSAQVQGDCYAESNIALSGSAVIKGNASASGTIGSGNITGNKTAGVPQQTPPSMATSDLNTLVQGVYNETFNIGSITPTGTTYSSGLTIQNLTQHYPAIYVIGDLTFQNINTVVFDSQVYVTGNINLAGGVQNLTFNGPVYGGGALTSSGSGTINFNSTLTIGSINLGGTDTFNFNNALKVMGNLAVGNSVGSSFGGTIYVDGNFNYGGASNLSISNDIYVKGSLTLGNSANLSGPEKVVVRGNVNISGASSLTNPNQLPFMIVPPGSTTPALAPPTDPTSVTLANSGHASAVIYAPTAAFSNSGSGSLYGAVISQSVTLGNSAQIIYPVGLGGLSNLPTLGGGPAGVSMTNWRSQ